jgi:hypothetical protein
MIDRGVWRVRRRRLAGCAEPGRQRGRRVGGRAWRPEAVRFGAQVAVRRVDYDEPESLPAALAGVAALVFISSDRVAESMRRHHEHVIAAAINAGIQHVVYTSILDVAPESRFYYAGVHRATETLLARSGIAHCHGSGNGPPPPDPAPPSRTDALLMPGVLPARGPVHAAR